jgi:hypothetical protein
MTSDELTQHYYARPLARALDRISNEYAACRSLHLINPFHFDSLCQMTERYLRADADRHARDLNRNLVWC